MYYDNKHFYYFFNYLRRERGSVLEIFDPIIGSKSAYRKIYDKKGEDGGVQDAP